MVRTTSVTIGVMCARTCELQTDVASERTKVTSIALRKWFAAVGIYSDFRRRLKKARVCASSAPAMDKDVGCILVNRSYARTISNVKGVVDLLVVLTDT